MEINNDKQLNQFIGKSIRLISLSSPSENFEERILQKIQTSEIKNEVLDKPLISKLTWILLGLGFVSLMVYLTTLFDTQQSLWIKNSNDIDTYFSRFFSTFEPLQFSSTVFYSVMCFFIMIAIQLPILKHYFDKQLKH